MISGKTASSEVVKFSKNDSYDGDSIAKRKCFSKHIVEIKEQNEQKPHQYETMSPGFQPSPQQPTLIKQQQVTIVPKPEATSTFRILAKPDDPAFEARCGEWAATVTEMMDKVNMDIPDCATYYPYIHAEYRPASIQDDESHLSILPKNQSRACEKKISANDIENDVYCKQYNPDNCFSQQEYGYINKKISDLRDKVWSEIQPKDWLFEHAFIGADLIQVSRENKAGNCAEKASYFAFLYTDKFPDHKVSILSLTGKGDHCFVLVEGDQIGSVIIDPWAYRYFPKDKIKLFLYNPHNNGHEEVKSNKITALIHAAMPENLPKEFQPVQEALNSIQGLDNKVDHLKRQYPEYEIIDCYLSLRYENDKSFLMTDGDLFLNKNNGKKSNKKLAGNHRAVAIKNRDKNSWSGFVVTEYGLHLFKPQLDVITPMAAALPTMPRYLWLFWEPPTIPTPKRLCHKKQRTGWGLMNGPLSSLVGCRKLSCQTTQSAQ